MKKVATAKASRPNKTAEPLKSGMVSTAERDKATLFEAILAEVDRARRMLRRHPDKVETSLEAIEGLVVGCEKTLDSISALADEAQERLGPAALAFASLDRLAQDGFIGGTGSSYRDSFMMALGGAIEDLRCIRNEVESIAKLPDQAWWNEVPASKGHGSNAYPTVDAAAEE
jgi:hypothetical protein